MKTPKRDYKTPANQLAQDIEPDFFEPDYNAQAARWKRKNRVAQLKRTIARLEREKEEAYHRGHKAGYDLGFSRYWF